ADATGFAMWTSDFLAGVGRKNADYAAASTSDRQSLRYANRSLPRISQSLLLCKLNLQAFPSGNLLSFSAGFRRRQRGCIFVLHPTEFRPKSSGVLAEYLPNHSLGSGLGLFPTTDMPPVPQRFGSRY